MCLTDQAATADTGGKGLCSHVRQRCFAGRDHLLVGNGSDPDVQFAQPPPDDAPGLSTGSSRDVQRFGTRATDSAWCSRLMLASGAPRTSTWPSAATMRAYGVPAPQPSSSRWSRVRHSAAAPTAALPDAGFPLRRAPGQVRIRSASRPSYGAAADSSASNPGISAVYAWRQRTGHSSKPNGMSSQLACAQSVPRVPSRSRSASTSVCDPPTTQPKALMLAWTIVGKAGRTPSRARSSMSCERVIGLRVRISSRRGISP